MEGNSDVEILKFLLGRKEEGFTIKKISEALGINYRIAYEQAMALEKGGLLAITRTGNSNICMLSGKFDSRIFEAEYLRRKDILKNKDFLVLHDRLAELRFPFVALLFGSHAKGTVDKHSDIDILTIGGDEKEIRSAVSLLPDKIHLNAVDGESFIRMARSREFTVVSEAMKKNVILVGIEDYYRLVSNAG